MHNIGRTLICAALALSACASTPPQTPALSAERALHERLLVLDTHLDTPALLSQPGFDITARHDARLDNSSVDLPRMIEGGLDGGFWVIYTPQGPRTDVGHANARDAALIRATEIHEMLAANADAFTLALKAEDVAPIAATGKRISFISMENSYPLGHDLTLMETFYKLGVRMMGPVHFANNELADSSTDPNGPEWGGLSPFGEEFVHEANRLGVLLDGSHAADTTVRDMLRLSATPIILSHTGVRALYDHPRNIDDDLLRELAAHGGVIQINAYGSYMADLPPTPERDAALAELEAQNITDPAQLREARRRINEQYPRSYATFETYMSQVLHALEIVGPDHVGFGADWDGGGGVEGMEDVAALPRITERLIAEGYSEEDLAKMWSGNILRLMRAVEDYAAAQSEETATLE